MSDKRIRLHYLQHVPFENLARIAVWAELRGHQITCESITAMLDNCSGEIVKGPCIQDRHAIISGCRHIDKLHPLLYSLLDSLESTFVRP